MLRALEKGPLSGPFGRALRSHRRGRGLDPLRVHQIENHLSENWGDFSFDHRNTTDGFQKILGRRAVM